MENDIRFVPSGKLLKLQAIQTEMLEYIGDICEQNGITYYLMFGTLLGAARHKGFISRDDDLDVVMPYDDYVNFSELIKM